MLRLASFIALAAACIAGLTAFRYEDPKYFWREMPANSTIAGAWGWKHTAPETDFTGEGDSISTDLNVLMFNYTSYDSVYVAKVKHLISNRLPGVDITDFWEGGADELANALADRQVVVVTYPSTGSASQVRAYGKVLAQYIQKGGAVVFSGTDKFGILQYFGLLDVDFGYFSYGSAVHESMPDHPVFNGTSAVFSLANYAYPLDISDPAFVPLAEIQGYPTVGYKNIGAGKVIYLGLEYYYDEASSSRILENTLRWLTPVQPAVYSAAKSWNRPALKRSEELLYAGSGNTLAGLDLKIYPNPYYEKATLDIDLPKAAQVSVEVTNEIGASVATLLPRRLLNTGFYRFDLPNVAPGVYYVKCQIDGQTAVRKVVKVAAP